ncbi:MAG: hypothetical protein GY874_19330 [Desulfobacteraceae bacterium]|nr:hypothetical protein [Desulfobacteraceae bacterium]
MRKTIRFLLTIHLCSILMALLIFCAPAFGQPDIDILSDNYSTYEDPDNEELRTIVRDNFDLEKKNSPILKAKAKVVRDESGKPDHLVVYLLSKEHYRLKPRVLI